MTTAYSELCKELYDLSGWSDTHYSYGYMEGKSSVVGMRGAAHAFDDPSPVYGLGYLLRKLPPYLPHTRSYLTLSQYSLPPKSEEVIGWIASYGHHAMRLRMVGDTPEHAACKLAIELFKLGILTRR